MTEIEESMPALIEDVQAVQTVQDTTTTQLAELRTLGYWLALAESGGSSEKERGAAAALRFYFARELGLPPLAAAEVSVIRGRLTVGAKLLRALAARQGYKVARAEGSDATSCTAILLRGGQEVGRYTFTIDQAKQAGLVKPNSAWDSYPERMLWQRASKFVLDDYAPDVTLGIWSDDEAAEIEPEQDWSETYDDDVDVEF